MRKKIENVYILKRIKWIVCSYVNTKAAPYLKNDVENHFFQSDSFSS